MSILAWLCRVKCTKKGHRRALRAAKARAEASKQREEAMRKLADVEEAAGSGSDGEGEDEEGAEEAGGTDFAGADADLMRQASDAALQDQHQSGEGKGGEATNEADAAAQVEPAPPPLSVNGDEDEDDITTGRAYLDPDQFPYIYKETQLPPVHRVSAVRFACWFLWARPQCNTMDAHEMFSCTTQEVSLEAMFFVNAFLGNMVRKTVRCIDVSRLIRMLPYEIPTLRIEVVIMLFKHLVRAVELRRHRGYGLLRARSHALCPRSRRICDAWSTYCGR